MGKKKGVRGETKSNNKLYPKYEKYTVFTIINAKPFDDVYTVAYSMRFLTLASRHLCTYDVLSISPFTHSPYKVKKSFFLCAKEPAPKHTNHRSLRVHFPIRQNNNGVYDWAKQICGWKKVNNAQRVREKAEEELK